MPEQRHKAAHSQTPFEALILTEQVRQLYAIAPIGYVASFINSLVVFFVAKDVTRFSVIASWLMGIWMTTGLFVALIVWFRSAPFDPKSAPLWKRRFLVALALAGLAWESIGLFPLAEISLAHQVFPTFVLGGMAAGSSSTFSMVKPKATRKR